jgi:hypothetical protein
VYCFVCNLTHTYIILLNTVVFYIRCISVEKGLLVFQQGGGGPGGWGGITSENLGSGSDHCQTRLNMGFTFLDTAARDSQKENHRAVITEMESVGEGVTAKLGTKSSFISIANLIAYYCKLINYSSLCTKHVRIPTNNSMKRTEVKSIMDRRA